MQFSAVGRSGMIDHLVYTFGAIELGTADAAAQGAPMAALHAGMTPSTPLCVKFARTGRGAMMDLQICVVCVAA